MPFRVMLLARELGSLSTRPIGAWVLPTKPPVPASPQVRLPVGYIRERLAGTPGVLAPCSFET